MAPPERRDPAAAVLAAVADPNRLRLLRVLLDGDRCVTQCMEATGMSQSLVSKHLARLIDAGLVERQRVGRRSYHRVRDSEQVGALLTAADAAAARAAR